MNLRVGPASPYCDIILTMPEGARVTKTHQAGSWSYVSYNGTRGWAHSDYLAPTGGGNICTNPPTPNNRNDQMILSHPQYETKGYKVLVRTGPSRDCTTGGLWANDNSNVTRLGTSDTWSRIQITQNGSTRTGWVETEFLTPR